MAELLKGAPVAAAITEGLIPRVEALIARGVTPTLAIVRVGERDDDLSYERGAEKRCAKVGVEVRKFVLPSDCSQHELMDVIAQVNGDPSIHGCLMFRPLPRTLDQDAACAALDPRKDVDCITAGSLYGVFANRPTRVTVVGRSLVIGKPVSMMLQARNATVTMCHTRTADLAGECSRAQILVAAAGHAGTVGADCVAPGQVVVDVGINWDESADRLVGDVDFEDVEPIVRAITPVPGGVGSVTTAILARHVIEAAERTMQEQ